MGETTDVHEGAGILDGLRHRSLRMLVGVIVLALPLQVGQSHSPSVRGAALGMLVSSLVLCLLWARRVVGIDVVGTTLVMTGGVTMMVRLLALLGELPPDGPNTRVAAGALAFQTFVVPALAAAMLWRPSVLVGSGAAWLAAVVGALFLVPRTPDWMASTASAGEVVRLLVFAAMTLLALNMLSTATHRMRRAEASARRASLTDELTRVPNRRGLRDALDDAVAQAGVLPGSGLLMVDIDHFKAVNDRLGHDVGDMALHAVATTLKATMRRGDVVGRWGGEEFLVVAGSIDDLGLHVLAERVRSAVTDLHLPRCEELTISVGATMLRHGDTLESAIARADRALYEAKARGRNRCVIAAR